jgi:hypothetical protein
MSEQMSDEPPSKVLGALPRTRPHRRSDKRAAAVGEPVGVEHPPAADARTEGTQGSEAPVAATPATVGVTPPPAPTGVTRPPAPTGVTRPPAPTGVTRPPAPTGVTPPPAPTGVTPPRASTSAPSGSVSSPKPPAASVNVLGTAVQAAAELAEIGLSLSARALRGALSRLPRP